MNGYSGYYPQVYAETLNRMESFPDDESIARLRRLRVRYVVVHPAFLSKDESIALLLKMGGDARLKPLGNFRDANGGAVLFLLSGDAASASDR